MTDQKVQTRVPDPMADDIETFQETGYMNKSEAVRKLLRDGLDANRPLDEEPNTDDTTTGETTVTTTRRRQGMVSGNKLVLAAVTLMNLVAAAINAGAL